MKRKGKLSKKLGGFKLKVNEYFTLDAIEIHSNTHAIITGCRKLTEYGKTRVVLRFRDYDIVITGEDLEPEGLINGQMALSGFITGVTYEFDKITD